MCGGFSLIETVRFGNLEFIADYFGGPSLSPKGGNSDAIFMGITSSGSPSLWAMIEDSTDEFYIASSREGSSSLPASQRHNMGAPPAPIATTPWSEVSLATQTMTMVPPWTLTPRLDTGLLPE
jgi:hypothetical protein